MITQSSIPDNARALSARMIELSTMKEIPSMRQYAEAWNKLGADFKAIGYAANSERCYRKYEYYRKQIGNEPEPAAPAQPYRYLYCDVEKTWTQHVLNMTGDTYVCGCGSQIEYSDEPRRAAVVEA